MWLVVKWSKRVCEYELNTNTSINNLCLGNERQSILGLESVKANEVVTLTCTLIMKLNVGKDQPK